MAKISVSIPDELKTQLDTYAHDTGLKRSEAVAHILDLFFTGQVQTPSPIDPDRIAQVESDLESVMNYLTDLHENEPDHFPKPEWVKSATSFISRSLGRSKR